MRMMSEASAAYDYVGVAREVTVDQPGGSRTFWAAKRVADIVVSLLGLPIMAG